MPAFLLFIKSFTLEDVVILFNTLSFGVSVLTLATLLLIVSTKPFMGAAERRKLLRVAFFPMLVLVNQAFVVLVKVVIALIERYSWFL